MTPILPEARLKEIEERERKATPGPWFYDSYSKIFRTVEGFEDDHDFFVAQVPCIAGDTATKLGSLNADFIAHARQDIPWLIAQLQAVTRERDKCAERMDFWGTEYIKENAKCIKAETERDLTIKERDELLKSFAYCAHGHLWIPGGSVCITCERDSAREQLAEAVATMKDSCLLQERQGRQRDSYKILINYLDRIREEK